MQTCMPLLQSHLLSTSRCNACHAADVVQVQAGVHCAFMQPPPVQIPPCRCYRKFAPEHQRTLALSYQPQAGAAAEAAAGGAAAEIEHFRLDMPPGCASGGPAAETAEKLLHLLALLKLNLVQRKVGAVRQWAACCCACPLLWVLGHAALAGAAEAQPGAAQGGHCAVGCLLLCMPFAVGVGPCCTCWRCG